MEKRFSILEPEKTKEELEQDQLYSGDYVRFFGQYGTVLRAHMATLNQTSLNILAVMLYPKKLMNVGLLGDIFY